MLRNGYFINTHASWLLKCVFLIPSLFFDGSILVCKIALSPMSSNPPKLPLFRTNSEEPDNDDQPQLKRARFFAPDEEEEEEEDLVDQEIIIENAAQLLQNEPAPVAFAVAVAVPKPDIDSEDDDIIIVETGADGSSSSSNRKPVTSSSKAVREWDSHYMGGRSLSYLTHLTHSIVHSSARTSS